LFEGFLEYELDKNNTNNLNINSLLFIYVHV